MDSSSTTDRGTFFLSVTGDTDVRITVRAELKVNGGTVQVLTGGPNATTGQIWSIYSDITVPPLGATGITLTATSGWNGNSYTASERSSGPFAILDTLYRARALLRDNTSDDAPALNVFWDPSYTDSNIGSSYYSPSQNLIRLLGEKMTTRMNLITTLLPMNGLMLINTTFLEMIALEEHMVSTIIWMKQLHLAKA